MKISLPKENIEEESITTEQNIIDQLEKPVAETILEEREQEPELEIVKDLDPEANLEPVMNKPYEEIHTGKEQKRNFVKDHLALIIFEAAIVALYGGIMISTVGLAKSIAGIVFYAVFLFFGLLAMWNIFEKMGQAGWKSLIPLYNTFILFKETFGSGLLMLLLFVPIVNAVILIMFQIKFAKHFGCGVGLIILTILFYPIMTLIFGLNNKYQWEK